MESNYENNEQELERIMEESIKTFDAGISNAKENVKKMKELLSHPYLASKGISAQDVNFETDRVSSHMRNFNRDTHPMPNDDRMKSFEGLFQQLNRNVPDINEDLQTVDKKLFLSFLTKEVVNIRIQQQIEELEHQKSQMVVQKKKRGFLGRLADRFNGKDKMNREKMNEIDTDLQKLEEFQSQVSEGSMTSGGAYVHGNVTREDRDDALQKASRSAVQDFQNNGIDFEASDLYGELIAAEKVGGSNTPYDFIHDAQATMKKLFGEEIAEKGYDRYDARCSLEKQNGKTESFITYYQHNIRGKDERPAGNDTEKYISEIVNDYNKMVFASNQKYLAESRELGLGQEPTQSKEEI